MLKESCPSFALPYICGVFFAGDIRPEARDILLRPLSAAVEPYAHITHRIYQRCARYLTNRAICLATQNMRLRNLRKRSRYSFGDTQEHSL